ALSATLFAQQAPSGYHRVACVKIKPDKGSEFRKWLADDLHKYAQSRVDAGALSSWMVLRSEIPTGESAECDYLFVSMYPGIPSEPMGMEDLGAALKKAGMAMSAQEYVDRRSSLTTLISNDMFQNEGYVGSFKKGDYLVVNYMKVSDDNMDDYLAWEKKVWKPLAEAMAKDGVRTGWSLNRRVLPGGSEQPFQAVTVDVFPTWESIYKDDSQFVDRWHKVHPDMELGTTFERYEKLRSMVKSDLYTVQDLIQSAK
ncbi:MAG: hypothetical protein WBQ95_16350, partial [Terracidiphilus sp.]